MRQARPDGSSRRVRASWAYGTRSSAEAPRPPRPVPIDRQSSLPGVRHRAPIDELVRELWTSADVVGRTNGTAGVRLALEACRLAHDLDADAVSRRRLVARSYVILGSAYLADGRLRRADAAFALSLAFDQRPTPFERADLDRRVALLRLAEGRLAEARAAIDAAVSSFRRMARAGRHFTGMALAARAALRLQQGRPRRALHDAVRSLALVDPHHPVPSRSARDLAVVIRAAAAECLDPAGDVDRCPRRVGSSDGDRDA